MTLLSYQFLQRVWGWAPHGSVSIPVKFLKSNLWNQNFAFCSCQAWHVLFSADVLFHPSKLHFCCERKSKVNTSCQESPSAEAAMPQNQWRTDRAEFEFDFWVGLQFFFQMSWCMHRIFQNKVTKCCYFSDEFFRACCFSQQSSRGES